MHSNLGGSGARSAHTVLVSALLALSMGHGPFVATALADPGSVRLRNGGRVLGDVTIVIPGDRVEITIPTGEEMTFPWDTVRTVLDGSRRYEADGSTTEVAPAEAPGSVPQAVVPPAPPPSVASAPVIVPSLVDLYLELPPRTRSRLFVGFGSFLLSNAVVELTMAAIFLSFVDSGGRVGGPLLASGVLSTLGGFIMIGRGAGNLHRRNRLEREMMSFGVFFAARSRPLTIDFDLAIGPDVAVPRLRMRF